jgi:hypothetical protein
MVIGNDVAGFINDKTRTLTRLLEFRLAPLAEITPEKI